MLFTQTLFAGAAFIAAALAVEINEFPSEVQAGRSYRITYTPGGDIPTTFILRKGENKALDTLDTLTTTATGGSFTWSVPSDLVNADDYALEIKQGTDFNFIGPIALSGGSEETSSAASSTASSTKSASATITSMTSVSAMPTQSANGTLSSVTLSRTSASPTGTETQGAPESTGAASALGSSPLALIFGAAAAMMYLN